jgi:hypothetical protein
LTVKLFEMGFSSELHLAQVVLKASLTFFSSAIFFGQVFFLIAIQTFVPNP